MAFTQNDLDAVERAIARGVRRVTYSDGQSAEFHSLDEMLRLRDQIKTELNSPAGGGVTFAGRIG